MPTSERSVANVVGIDCDLFGKYRFNNLEGCLPYYVFSAFGLHDFLG